MTRRLYVFAMPDAEGAARFQPVVDALAATFGGPRFEAHLTLLVGEFASLEALDAGVAAAAAALPPPLVTPTLVDIGTSFTKCVFQRFAPHPGLAAITERLRVHAEAPNTYVFDPHVSLLYGDAETGARARGAAEVSGGALRLDRLRIVETSGRSTRPSVVKRWHTHTEHPFSG